MTSWRNLFVITSLLPAIAGAADPAMLALVMPDARALADINIAQVLASPLAQAVKAEVDKSNPQWRQQLMETTGKLLGESLQEVLIANAGGSGANARVLLIVRSVVDLRELATRNAPKARTMEYQGVPLLVNQDSAMAFLDGSIVVLGKLAEVQAAVRRRGRASGVPPALAQGVERSNGRYDAWIVAAGPLAPLVPKSGAGLGAELAPLQHVTMLQAAVRMSPDVELSTDVAMTSAKDAADLAAMVHKAFDQARLQGPVPLGLENLLMTVDGTHVRLTLRLPEEQVRLALQKRPKPAKSDVPPGSIRITSSPKDMGTVILPADKNH